jgi:hypothetical protein
MFSDIWQQALKEYRDKRNAEEKIRISRLRFKYENELMKNQFILKYSHISKKETSLLKFILNKNATNILNQEYYQCCKSIYYKYYILFNPNFFKYEYLSPNVYMIYLSWNCFNCFKQINDESQFRIKFKFFKKHDYPYNLTLDLVDIFKKRYTYINSFNREYLYYKLMKLWQSS